MRRLACDPVPSKALQRQQGKAKAQQDKDGGLEDFELWPRGEAKRRAAHEEHAQLWKQRYKRAMEEFDKEAYEQKIDEFIKDDGSGAAKRSRATAPSRKGTLKPTTSPRPRAAECCSPPRPPHKRLPKQGRTVRCGSKA